MKREEVPSVVSRRLGGRPVRWASRDSFVGGFEGRERVLEVFEADATDQLVLRHALADLRDMLKEAAGGPLLIIFHTTAESHRLYPDFLRSFNTSRGLPLPGPDDRERSNVLYRASYLHALAAKTEDEDDRDMLTRAARSLVAYAEALRAGR